MEAIDDHFSPAISVVAAGWLACPRSGVDSDLSGRARIAMTDDECAGRDLVVKWMRELSA